MPPGLGSVMNQQQQPPPAPPITSSSSSSAASRTEPKALQPTIAQPDNQDVDDQQEGPADVDTLPVPPTITTRDRSPHPYARRGSTLHPVIPTPTVSGCSTPSHLAADSIFPSSSYTHLPGGSHQQNRRPSLRNPSQSTSQAPTTSSESGTEADDEHDGRRPSSHLLKALPAPVLRPRKGLRSRSRRSQDQGSQVSGSLYYSDGGEDIGDAEASALLTPAELDRDEERNGYMGRYFDSKPRRGRENVSRGDKSLGSRDEAAKDAQQGDLDAERARKVRDVFFRRKRAERVRRFCESALLGLIGCLVISGQGVLGRLLTWHRELLSQILVVVSLIAIYPLRVVTREPLDNGSRPAKRSILHRFRVPASFDPASVLYPTFVPVLVALSLLPQFPALLLPNLILGLASLPPRLFPPASRVVDINTLHWLLSIIPLLASENTEFPSKRFPPPPYKLKAQGPPFLHPEMLVLLYPLHHVLLPVLNYLTTTSLLPAEKHMLAAGLVNLLCFALSPQAAILRALLWVGGVWVLVTSTQVLNWNVALARVPKWRFRRSSTSKKSPLHEMTIALWGLVSPARHQQQDDSDADEDGYVPPRKDSRDVRPLLRFNSFLGMGNSHEPKSAVEASPNDTLDYIATFTGLPRKRRHTIASLDEPKAISVETKTRSSRIKPRKPRTWYLDLTSEGAALRKWLYAGWVYFAVVCIVLVPVRFAVSRHALQGAEPVTWALEYLFEDLMALYFTDMPLSDSIRAYLYRVQHTVSHHLSWSTFSVPQLRLEVGEANTRLLLAGYWAVVVAIGIATVLHLAPRIEVDTRRKIFHATIVTMLLPTTFIDPCFCALALSVVLAIFLILEVIRAGQVAPLGVSIGRFIAPYVDGRDLRGPMVVSHVFLLIGCAIPLWLSLSGLGRATEVRWPGWEIEEDRREVAMIAGVVCVGMGDAAASLIGRRYGKRKWPWMGGKSLEGSTAFAVAVMIGLMAAKVWLHLGGWTTGTIAEITHASSFAADNQGARHAISTTAGYWALQTTKALLCGCGASFMEAVLTGANDNVVVPVALWLLVRGFGV